MKLTATSFSTTLNGMDQEVIDLHLEEEIRDRAIKLAQESFERGEYLTHEQVGVRLKQLFKS